MSANKLSQYVGPLTPEQVADGMNVARRNAQRLAEDAELLLKNSRFASACALAILSIEDSGKLAILRQIAAAKSDDELKRLWREFRSHTKKNLMGIFSELFAKGARRLDEFASMFDPNADHPKLIDQVKQLGFYSDCLGDVRWSEPALVIDEPLARVMVLNAGLLSKTSETTTREIELWIRHVGPRLYGNADEAVRGLEGYWAAMQEAGLAPAGPNGMATFIREGIGPSLDAECGRPTPM